MTEHVRSVLDFPDISKSQQWTINAVTETNKKYIYIDHYQRNDYALYFLRYFHSSQ
jgi:hypothetical protein